MPNENGQKIICTIYEDTVYSYTTLSIEGDTETGFTVINQYWIEYDDEEPPLATSTGENIGETLLVTMLSILDAVLYFLNRIKRKTNG